MVNLPDPTGKLVRLPRRAYWLILIVLMITVYSLFQWFGAIEAIEQIRDGAAVQPILSPGIPVLLFGAWSIVWMVILAGYVIRARWADRALIIGFGLWAICQFGYGVLMFRSDYDRGRLPFLAMAWTIGFILLSVLVWVRALMRKAGSSRSDRHVERIHGG